MVSGFVGHMQNRVSYTSTSQDQEAYIQEKGVGDLFGYVEG